MDKESWDTVFEMNLAFPKMEYERIYCENINPLKEAIKFFEKASDSLD